MNSPFPLSPPQKAIESLLALRDYYAPLVEEYEKLYTLAKANLTHVEALLSNWSLTEEVDNDNEEFTSEKGKNFFLFLSEESVNDDVEPITHPLLDDSQDTSTVATQLLDSTQQNIFTLIQAWSGEESDATTDSPFLLEPPIQTSTQQRDRSLEPRRPCCLFSNRCLARKLLNRFWQNTLAQLFTSILLSKCFMEN